MKKNPKAQKPQAARQEPKTADPGGQELTDEEAARVSGGTGAETGINVRSNILTGGGRLNKE